MKILRCLLIGFSVYMSVYGMAPKARQIISGNKLSPLFQTYALEILDQDQEFYFSTVRQVHLLALNFLTDSLSDFNRGSWMKINSRDKMKLNLLDVSKNVIILEFISDLSGNLLDRKYPSIGFYELSSAIVRLIILEASENRISIKFAETLRDVDLKTFDKSLQEQLDKLPLRDHARIRARNQGRRQQIVEHNKNFIERNQKIRKIIDNINKSDHRSLEKSLSDFVSTDPSAHSTTIIMLIYLFKQLKPFFVAHNRKYLDELKTLSVSVPIHKQKMEHLVLKRIDEVWKRTYYVFYEEFMKDTLPREVPVDTFYADLLGLQSKLSFDLGDSLYRVAVAHMNLLKTIQKYIMLEIPKYVDTSPDKLRFYDAIDEDVETTDETFYDAESDDNESTEVQSDDSDDSTGQSFDERTSRRIKVKTRKEAPSSPTIVGSPPKRDPIADQTRKKALRDQTCKDAASMKTSARYLYHHLFDMRFTSRSPTDFSTETQPIHVWFKASEVIMLCKLSNSIKGAKSLNWEDVSKLFQKMGIKIWQSAEGSRERWVVPRIAETRGYDSVRSGPVSKSVSHSNRKYGFVTRVFHRPVAVELDSNLAPALYKFLMDYVEFDFSRLKVE